MWVCSTEGRDVWCANLGPCAKVAEVLSQWLGTVDFDALEAKRYERANPG